MAKGKKTGGRDIKPGQVLNPHGGRLHNPAWRAIKQMTHEDLSALLHFVSNANADELQKRLKDPETPVLELAVIKCFDGVLKNRRSQDFDRLMNRMIGTRPQELIVKNPEGESFRSRPATLEEVQAELAAIAAQEKARNG